MIKMGSWGTGIFSNDLAADVKHEYGILLSVGKKNEQIESMLMEYYADILNKNDPEEDIFWFALSYCEWKRGRLSGYVKEKALCAIESGRDLEIWHAIHSKNYKQRKLVLDNLGKMLRSPMPPAKKIRKPTVRHCPWPIGSLLAYRLVADSINQNPCFGKYVLLRIVAIGRRPLSDIFDTGYYNDSMIVGLYNWIGNTIPQPEIVKNLEYIPISKTRISPQLEYVHRILKEIGLYENSNVSSIMQRAENNVVVDKCVHLDWTNGASGKGEILLLGQEPNFADDIPDFFRDSLKSSVFSGIGDFDIMLSHIFDKKYRDADAPEEGEIFT